MNATTLPATTANPATLMRAATDAAGVCAEIVKRGCITIKGKKYPCIEAWQSIAAAFGCTLSAGNVEIVPGGGFRATGEVRRMSDGAVISTAEGYCGSDETEWARRPVFARRAMAQTRAQSRAARAAFAFVVLLIDRNLSTIPAEEIPARGTPEDVTPAETPAAVQPVSPVKPVTPAASGTRKGGGIFAKPAKPAPAADTSCDDPADGEARAILADLIGEREDAANRLLEGRGLIPEGGSFRDLAADKVRELVANPIRLRKAIAAAEGGAA